MNVFGEFGEWFVFGGCRVLEEKVFVIIDCVVVVCLCVGCRDGDLVVEVEVIENLVSGVVSDVVFV